MRLETLVLHRNISIINIRRDLGDLRISKPSCIDRTDLLPLVIEYQRILIHDKIFLGHIHKVVKNDLPCLRKHRDHLNIYTDSRDQTHDKDRCQDSENCPQNS